MNKKILILRIASLLSFIVFCIFLFIGDGVPEINKDFITNLVINYFHTFTWLCLTIFFGMWSLPEIKYQKIGKGFGIAALILYIVFRIYLAMNF